ncbi:hypothetical protein Tco_0540157 [Tanacetum coccineum]
MSATLSNHIKILAIHEASRECVWLRSVIQYIRESCGISLGLEAPTVVHEDNVACMTQLKDGYIKGDKTKHILSRTFLFTKVRSTDNQADLFTKVLPTTTFKKLVHDTGMRRLNELKRSNQKRENIRQRENIRVALFFSLAMVFSHRVFPRKVFHEATYLSV